MLTQPREHQRVITNKLMSIPSVFPVRPALLSECGTGKTWVILYLIEHRRLQPAIIFCPARVVKTWKNEIAKHLGEYDVTVIEGNVAEKLVACENSHKSAITICSYPTYIRQYWKILDPKKYNFVVADEASIFSGYAATAQKIMARFFESKNKAIMTGTIIAENYVDVFSPYKFLDNGNTFGNSLRSFRYKYFYNNGSRWVVTKYGKRTIMDILKSDPFTFMMTKDECLDLPPKTYQQVYYDVTKEQKKFLEELDRLWEARIYDGGGNLISIQEFQHILQMMQKKLQCSSGFIYETNGNDRRPLFFKENPKLEVLKGLLSELKNEKVIIVYTFKIEEELLRSIEIPIAKTDEDIAQFENDNNQMTMAIHLDRVSFGLNLQFSNNMIFFNNSFSGKKRMQCEDRVHRDGQTKKVHIIDIICEDAFDAYVFNVLKNKQSILTELYDALKQGTRPYKF